MYTILTEIRQNSVVLSYKFTREEYDRTIEYVNHENDLLIRLKYLAFFV